ncbi:slo-interacting protein 1 [Drosophila willistoni]|nr:slo-interacting protein 1 [Drosophila willistoni]
MEIIEYVAIKVNGYDICNLSNYEAVQMFLQAKETLVVELCRQQRKENKNNDGSDDSAGDSPQNKLILTLRTGDPQTVTPAPSIDKETQTVDQDIARTIADHFIEQEHHLFEQCLEPEIDIEEITLVRRVATDTCGDTDSGSAQKIGLSVCCNGFFSSHSDDSSDIVKTTPPLSHLATAAAAGEDAVAEDAADDEAEACEDVFISDIQPESIAERDGRLRRGDQILRINGVDIKSKEEAEAQIAESENGSTAVTLLVSRLLYPEDDEDEDIESNFEYANSFLPDDYTNVVDKLDKLLLSQVVQPSKAQTTNEISAGTCNTLATISTPVVSQHKTDSQNVSKGQQNSNLPVQKSMSTSCCHSKTQIDGNLSLNQSVGQTPSTVKTQNQNHKQSIKSTVPKNQRYEYDESEHIYETIPEDSESEPLYCSPYQSSNYMTALGSCSSAATGADAEPESVEMEQQSQRVAQWLGLKSQSQGSPHLNSRVQHLQTHTLAGRPSQIKQHQQQRISNRVFTLRSTLTNTSGSSSSGAGYIDNGNIILGEEIDNSSSAYNTGGSNNSASPRQNLLNAADATDDSKLVGKPQMQPQSLMLSPKEPIASTPVSSMLMLPFGRSGRIGLCSSSECSAQPKASSSIQDDLQVFGSTLLRTDFKLMRLKQSDEAQSQCPQFNAPNLSRYHFVSSQEVAIKNQNTMGEPKPSSIMIGGERVNEEIPMVWKVKRRPDGTRYIVKRPVRNRVPFGLRKNNRNNEVTTTEDDTVSEVKIGRYWTKEERKRHIERARERRHHQQQQQQQ